jgi:ankyrin repeat protein
VLLRYGADVTATTATSRATALHIAAGNGDARSVRTLLVAGADANAAMWNTGETPLHIAARLGHTLAAASLIRGGAVVGATDAKGRTPLQAAALYGHAGVVSMLLENGADIAEAGRWHGWTALHAAAAGGHVDVAAVLLRRGAPIDATHPAHGMAPLHVGQMEVVEALLELGASIHAADTRYRRTALHWAAWAGHPWTMEVLLRHGADANARDAAGLPPLLLATIALCQCAQGVQ